MEHRRLQTILVVDDNPATLYAVARMLRAAGFQTMETLSGAEALELAEYASAIVLDVNLPDIHGLEVARLIRAHPRTAATPIIHITAAAVTQQDVQAGLDAGADRFLRSPVEPAEIVGIIDALLASSPEGTAAGPLDWREAHMQLLSAERRLFIATRQFREGRITATELDAQHEQVRTMRSQAEAALAGVKQQLGTGAA